MQNITINYKKIVLISLILLVTIYLSAEANASVDSTFAKGKEWSLTVEGIQNNLKIIREPEVKHKSNREVRFFTRISWGGVNGSILGRGDTKNSSYSITLNLTSQKSGNKIICTGYIAKRAAKFMAGTCGDKSNGSAWYAVPKGSTLQVAKHPFSSYENRINGDYYTTAPKKPGSITLQVGSKLFPDIPKSNKVFYKWLNKHNSSLLHITQSYLNNSEKKRFSQVENNKCGDDIFCKIAFKQHTIQCALFKC